MTDIVERLRAFADRERPYGRLPDALDEAAAEIERLRAALRGLIGAVADHTSQKSIPQALIAARAALEGKR